MVAQCLNHYATPGQLVYLVGFIIKKFVTMHGHMNVKFEHFIFCNNNFSFIFVSDEANRASYFISISLPNAGV